MRSVSEICQPHGPFSFCFLLAQAATLVRIHDRENWVMVV